MSKMKYSGVEWIGDIPNEWIDKLAKLDYIEDLVDKFSHPLIDLL